MPADAVFEVSVLSGEHGERPVGVAAPDPGGGTEPAAFRSPADPRDAAAGRLEGEPQACASAVSSGGPAAAHADATAQAHVPASRYTAGGDPSGRALEHGFCS